VTAPTRPAVDIVVPFAGPRAALERIATALSAIRIAPDDTIVIVDNTAGGAGDAVETGVVRVVRADRVPSSYFARNRGAAVGENEWVVFLDADVDPPADLVDAYFARLPHDTTGMLVGAVRDVPPDGALRPTAAVRYAHLRAVIDQEGTMSNPRWAYAKTANCAVRRSAFDALGGFREDIRSGGDADLCFRLKEAGWKLEWRREAEVVHRSREGVRDLLRQRAKHGSGSEWLNRRYPGFSPRPRPVRVAASAVRRMLAGTLALARGNRDKMLVDYLDAASNCAFELGRFASNVVRPRDRADP